VTHNEQLVKALLDYLDSGDDWERAYAIFAHTVAMNGGAHDFYGVLGRVNELKARIGVDDVS